MCFIVLDIHMKVVVTKDGRITWKKFFSKAVSGTKILSDYGM